MDIVVTCPAIVVGTYPVERLSRARIDLRFPQSASEGRLFPLFLTADGKWRKRGSAVKRYLAENK